MRLLDFVRVFKGNLDCLFLTFPFSSDCRKHIPFYESNVYSIRNNIVISIENFDDKLILSLVDYD